MAEASNFGFCYRCNSGCHIQKRHLDAARDCPAFRCPSNGMATAGKKRTTYRAKVCGTEFCMGTKSASSGNAN
jgi:hypothetical protein